MGRAFRADAPGLLAFAAIVTLLGSNFVVVRVSNAELAPFWGAALRFLAASAILAGIVPLARAPLPRGKALSGAIAFGALNFGATYAFLYWALLHVRSGATAVLFATLPLVTLLLAVVTRMESFRWRGVAGASVVAIGLALVFRGEIASGVPVVAVAAVLGGVLASAIATIVVKRAPRAHPLAVNAVGMPVGAVLLLALSAIAREPHPLPALGATWLALAWLVGSTIGAFTLVVWILGRWPASSVSYAAVSAPIVTVALAAILAGDAVTWALVAGGAIVALGVYVGALAGAKPRASEPPSEGPQPASRSPPSRGA